MSTDTPLTDAIPPLTPPDQWRAFAKKLERELGEAKAEEAASYKQFPCRMTKEAYLADAKTRYDLRALLAQQAAASAGLEKERDELNCMCNRLTKEVELFHGGIFRPRLSRGRVERLSYNYALERGLAANRAGLITTLEARLAAAEKDAQGANRMAVALEKDAVQYLTLVASDIEAMGGKHSAARLRKITDAVQAWFAARSSAATEGKDKP